tara:strand:+ start:146 stop:1165 length:1020 start_codon:yes stop_codon:yes gene_type:complete
MIIFKKFFIKVPQKKDIINIKAQKYMLKVISILVFILFLVSNALSENPKKNKPDFKNASKVLGISIKKIKDALGPPPPNFVKASRILGITENELKKALHPKKIISSKLSNNVTIKKNEKITCIQSNGVPNHEMGSFPTKQNPHSFKAQRLQYCFPSNPIKKSKHSYSAKTVGISINGIPIRPGTADWYDKNSLRKHSKNKSSGWNLEAITPNKKIFGIDQNNAHVDKRGLYHYHGVPPKLINFNNKTLIGYAADGHEIHYIGKKVQSSWGLKKGNRSTEPYGLFDGTYFQDYEFINGLGNLDECNGAIHENKYVYFATDIFPYFPRCHWGEVSKDFIKP